MSFFNLKFAVFFHEHVFIKDPGTTHGTPWHQDQPYYPVNGRKVLLESIILFFSPPPPPACQQPHQVNGNS